jgi:hypothetical protein
MVCPRQHGGRGQQPLRAERRVVVQAVPAAARGGRCVSVALASLVRSPLRGRSPRAGRMTHAFANMFEHAAGALSYAAARGKGAVSHRTDGTHACRTQRLRRSAASGGGPCGRRGTFARRTSTGAWRSARWQRRYVNGPPRLPAARVAARSKRVLFYVARPVSAAGPRDLSRTRPLCALRRLARHLRRLRRREPACRWGRACRHGPCARADFRPCGCSCSMRPGRCVARRHGFCSAARAAR